MFVPQSTITVITLNSYIRYWFEVLFFNINYWTTAYLAQTTVLMPYNSSTWFVTFSRIILFNLIVEHQYYKEHRITLQRSFI